MYQNYFPTPIRTSSTSLIKSFSLSTRGITDIYSDNVWESRQCMILHLYLNKMISVNYNQFDKHFCFFHYMLKTNRSDLSFAVHKFWKLNVQIGMSSFVRESLFHTSIQSESKQLLPAKKSRRSCMFFNTHLSIHKRNDVAWFAAFLKKTVQT